MEIKYTWIDIISKIYKDLHNSPQVMHKASIATKRRERILQYFDRLERIHEKVARYGRNSDLQLLKKFYHDIYVIKPENIPNSYFENQRKIMKERGFGNIDITPEQKQRLIAQIIADQEASLDKWLEYFLFDEESKSYEIWEKYWVFQGLQSLGKYDKETGKFTKRDKTTVYPFPPVEKEAIFTTLKLMEEYLKNKTGDAEIKSALGSGNFKILYEYSLQLMMNKNNKVTYSNNGKWIKYEQGSDYPLLRDSLQGYYTGWCTAAGENFAKDQLAAGDFYIYYSLDENNEAKIPRIAIRMTGSYTIAEIRGIAQNQNVEEEMLPILHEKLKEFPDRDKYLKKEHDMALLTKIDKKNQNNIELSIDELMFLYEIDYKIAGFGQISDPRIDEIKSQRNTAADFTIIFKNINRNNWGDLDLSNITSAKELIIPASFHGSLNLRGLTSAADLTIPTDFQGLLNLSGLKTAKSLNIPYNFSGTLNLSGLQKADDLNIPIDFQGSLILNGLTDPLGLILPKHLAGNLELNKLTDATHLFLPDYIGGNLCLQNLISATNLNLPKYIGKSLDLSNLEDAQALVLPSIINGSLYLTSLSISNNLNLPKYIAGDLYLSNLYNAHNLVLPEFIGGYLDLSNLTSAEGLLFPIDFDLSKLLVPYNVEEEILNNPDKYFRKEQHIHR